MERKPFVGMSICAVVLLVLASLTNVVGYQSVKSTVNDSPLFQTRTQRATNQQQNSITSEYLGMDKGNLLKFPIKDNKTEQLKNAVDFISKMGDKTFAHLIELYIQKARQDTTLQGLSDYQIVQALLLLKTNPKAILNIFTNKDNHPITSSEWFSLCQWGPIYCIVFNILLLISFVYFIILLYKSGPTAFTCISGCMCLN
jgi:hypothetical protein